MVALVTELAPKCFINFGTVIRLQLVLCSLLVYACLLTGVLAVLRRCIFPGCGVTCDVWRRDRESSSGGVPYRISEALSNSTIQHKQLIACNTPPPPSHNLVTTFSQVPVCIQRLPYRIAFWQLAQCLSKLE